MLAEVARLPGLLGVVYLAGIANLTCLAPLTVLANLDSSVNLNNLSSWLIWVCCVL